MNVIEDQFIAFRQLPEYMHGKKVLGHTQFLPEPNPRIATTTGNIPTTMAPIQSSSRPSYSQVDMFMKGVKRDPSVFTTLKDEKFHYSWHPSFENQVCPQGLNKIIDTSYADYHGRSRRVQPYADVWYLYAVLEWTSLRKLHRSRAD